MSCAQAEIAKRKADAVLDSVRICIKAPYYSGNVSSTREVSTGQAGIASMITKSADVGYT